MHAKTIIIGRLGRDPEMRYTPDGTPVTNFSVATDKVWYDGDGKKHERTTWYRVTAWRRLAETCNQYLRKGRQVMVDGEMQEPKPYEGRDGSWRASLDLRADTVKFLGGGRNDEGDSTYGESPDAASRSDTLGELDDDLESIPF